MKVTEQRLCIYPKDIQFITGKSYRQSVRIAQQIHKQFNKSASAYITISEFCLFSGLPYEEVVRFVK